MLSRTSSVQHSFQYGDDDPLGILRGENEDHRESIEMKSMEMANPYGYSVSGAPGNGYGKRLLKGGSYPEKKVKLKGQSLTSSSNRMGLSLSF